MNLSSTIGSSDIDIRPRFIMAQQPFTLSILVIHTWFYLSHWCHASPQSVRPCTKWASDQSTAQAPRPITVHNADRARPELDKAAPMAKSGHKSIRCQEICPFFGKVVAAWCVLVINCLLLSFLLWISVLCFGRHPRRAITSQQKCDQIGTSGYKCSAPP